MTFLTLGICLVFAGLLGLGWVILSSIIIRHKEHSNEDVSQNKLNKQLLILSRFHLASIFCSILGFLFIIFQFIFK